MGQGSDPAPTTAKTKFPVPDRNPETDPVGWTLLFMSLMEQLILFILDFSY